MKSYNLHKNVVKKLNSNIEFYKTGKIKSSLTHRSDFFDDYQFTPLIDVESIDEKSSYQISFENDKLIIQKYDKYNEFIKEYIFDGMSSKTKNHDLPFDLVINDISDLIKREIRFLPFRGFVNAIINKINIKQTGVESDQLEFKINDSNIKISEDFLNQLITDLIRTESLIGSLNTRELWIL